MAAPEPVVTDGSLVMELPLQAVAVALQVRHEFKVVAPSAQFPHSVLQVAQEFAGEAALSLA